MDHRWTSVGSMYVLCYLLQLTKHPETRGGINEKTISICIDPNQEKPHRFMHKLNKNFVVNLTYEKAFRDLGFDLHLPNPVLG